ncbi:MAG TPA: DUF1080 domain-containing protein [Pirellulaceae bacterium]|nr:DUF1080 domain-containing protein [Pirellulaceae bacterium]
MRRLLGLVVMMSVAGSLCSYAAAEDKKDAGFKSIFDGKTLTGWQGATDGYQVVDGAIQCIAKKGGFLYTDKEYGDFHLKFEFKLTPGANNGVGIRAPKGGDPAYVGMEIQVLDDTADQYKNLKEYQYHGSIYGVAAAKRGHQKKVGEWNTEEIIAKGKHIQIILNGETIVDADIEKLSTPKTVDGNNHPGLKREQGFIVFCGHGHDVFFRNIEIKELGEKKE